MNQATHGGPGPREQVSNVRVRIWVEILKNQYLVLLFSALQV
jgi:hypothetical protein